MGVPLIAVRLHGILDQVEVPLIIYLELPYVSLDHTIWKLTSETGQKIFFYKNHPIRFVSVVGVIIARNEITRRTILTMDDSSGATLDVVVQQADPKEAAKIQADQGSNSTAKQADTAASLDNLEETPGILPMQALHLSTTDRTILDISKLVPGTMVKVKGTLSQFRSVVQLQLERFTLVPDTNAEMQFVDERLQFLVGVLSVPWVLSEEEVEQLRVEAEEGGLKVVEERKRAERRARRREEREERDQRHILKRYEREERKRRKEASVCQEEGLRVMQDIRRKRVISREGSC